MFNDFIANPFTLLRHVLLTLATANPRPKKIKHYDKPAEMTTKTAHSDYASGLSSYIPDRT